MEKWDGSHTIFCGTNGEEQTQKNCKLWKVPNEILHKQINNMKNQEPSEELKELPSVWATELSWDVIS